MGGLAHQCGSERVLDDRQNSSIRLLHQQGRRHGRAGRKTTHRFFCHDLADFHKGLPESGADETGRAHFACNDSMYLFKFATRNCTSELCPWLMCQNSLPQTGISFEPCAGRCRSPWIAFMT